jgi:3-phenylpropionate/trans-cinnamate dioxygenase ferredoxin subunit
MLDRCPHQGGSLSAGVTTGLLLAPQPGQYQYIRKGEFIRCPWHGWEFDIKTGQSWCAPDKFGARQYPVEVAAGGELVKGPYIAETVPVSVEEQYVVVEV